ncbi:MULTISPECIES: hypothetical protein [unclassified Streptomyces]|uniref:hypothetical protein n=1 Tax=unclassified Streptomyces TaxID=2593676 RepID=UPI0036FDFC77
MSLRRGMTALAVAIGLAVSVAGCSGADGGKKPAGSASASASRGGGGPQPSTQEGQSDTRLAELKGPDGLLLQITSVERDTGGFVTVSGALKNDSGKSAVIPAQLSGDETEVLRHGRSLGGATLVDSKGKKRYYVLRDTEGRPLTTTGIATVRSGESIPVFLQFPAPPADVPEVTFQLPMFAPATLQISG